MWIRLVGTSPSLDLVGKKTYLAYRTPGYNLDTQLSVPSDERTDIRLQLNSTRTSRTTNILAYAEGCTRAETHTRHPSCKARAANVCKQLLNALCPEDGWGVVLVVGSFGEMVTCAVVDIARAREGNPKVLTQVDISDHL